MPDQISDRLASATAILYLEGEGVRFDMGRIRRYLKTTIGVGRVLQRVGLPGIASLQILDRTSRALAAARVTNPLNPAANSPMPREIEQERRRLLSGRISGGIVYDGVAFQKTVQGVLEECERTMDYVHIVFTEALLATFERPEMRYHLRTVTCGYPSIVSLAGLVEAPARNGRFHMARRLVLPSWIEEPSRLADDHDHLEWGDPRMTEVAIGYAVQGLGYWLWGQPFCENPECRLFNAHGQYEMLRAQLRPPEYCAKHRLLLSVERRPGVDKRCWDGDNPLRRPDRCR